MDGWGGAGTGATLPYRAATGQAGDGRRSRPTALLQTGAAGGKWGHSCLKVPSPPWLGEDGLALSVLLRDYLWRREEEEGDRLGLVEVGAREERAAQGRRMWHTPLLLPPGAGRAWGSGATTL